MIYRSGTKRFHFPIKMLPQQLRLFLKIASVDLVAPRVSRAMKVVVSNQKFSKVQIKPYQKDSNNSFPAHIKSGCGTDKPYVAINDCRMHPR